jgi:small-conductance mechanosensitive channel
VDYSVNISVRMAMKLNDYWDVLYQGFARVKGWLNKEGIHIQYP